MRRPLALGRSVVAALVAGVLSGCGTLGNLFAPPETSVPLGRCTMAPDSCVPFGGVGRSMVLGAMCLGTGVMAPVGVGVLLVDAPLSLVGDVVTLPVVYACQSGAPWATWWGSQKRRQQTDEEWRRFWLSDPPGTATPVDPEAAPRLTDVVPAVELGAPLESRSDGM
jgi:hypothetical protein